MTFKFECPHCGQRIGATLDDVATAAACPTCRQALVVPSPPVGHAIVDANVSQKTSGKKPRGVAEWLRNRPRESRGLRLMFRFAICIIMVFLAICGLGGVGGALAIWNSAQSASELVVRQPSTRIQSEAPKQPPDDPSQFARAITRVNIQLLNINSNLSQAVNHPAMLEAALVQLASQAALISTQGCPDDFVIVWQRYVTTMDQMVSGLRAAAEVGRRSPNGKFQSQQELTDGTIIGLALMATTAQMGSVENEIVAAAARYGVEWRRMGK